jgi:hypothetical protein
MLLLQARTCIVACTAARWLLLSCSQRCSPSLALLFRGPVPQTSGGWCAAVKLGGSILSSPPSLPRRFATLGVLRLVGACTSVRGPLGRCNPFSTSSTRRLVVKVSTADTISCASSALKEGVVAATLKATGQDYLAAPNEFFIARGRVHLVMERAYCSLDACLSVTVHPTTHPPPCTRRRVLQVSTEASQYGQVHPSSVDAWDNPYAWLLPQLVRSTAILLLV